MGEQWERKGAQVYQVDFNLIRNAPAVNERIERNARANAYIQRHIDKRQRTRSRRLLWMAFACAVVAGGLTWALVLGAL